MNMEAHMSELQDELQEGLQEEPNTRDGCLFSRPFSSRFARNLYANWHKHTRRSVC